eukprot:5155985-Pyramimonas_sp.AAC.1
MSNTGRLVVGMVHEYFILVIYTSEGLCLCETCERNAAPPVDCSFGAHVKSSQAMFDTRLKVMEDNMVEFSRWKEECMQQNAGSDQNVVSSADPDGIADQTDDSIDLPAIDLLRNEVAELRESGQKSIEQAISLMDTAVFRMQKQLDEKVDQSALDDTLGAHV